MIAKIIGIDFPSLIEAEPRTPLSRAWGALGSGLSSTLGLLCGDY